MRTAGWTDSTTVLDRISAVFDAFGEGDEGLGVSELARRANLPKSTVSRIAADLVVQRLLDRDGDTLYLGVRLFELGQTVEQPQRLRELALPVMTELRNVTGLTVQLAIPEGKDVVFVAIVKHAPGSKAIARVGGRLPAHATAPGKAMMAYSSDETLRRMIGDHLERRTPRTICTAVDLRRELGEIRRSGVSTDREECATGHVGVASPILAHGAAPIAAISVTGAPGEVACDRVAPAVRAAAITIGHRVDAPRTP